MGTRPPVERRHASHLHMQRLWRVGRWLRRRHVPLLPTLVRVACRILYAADVPLRLDLPRGVVLMHNGLGTVIHGDVRIAGPALVFHHVTMGDSKGGRPGVPSLGSRVVVGAGAVLLGGITVGDDCVVGANAVVTRDVPSGMMAVGNPAVLRPADIARVRSWFEDAPAAPSL